VAAAALAVAEAVVAVGGPIRPSWYGTLYPVVGTAYVGSGLLAWYRRPANRMGPLLVGAGVVMYLAGFELTGVVLLGAIGLVFSLAPIAVILHLLLAFPTGRLTGRPARALAATGYLLVVGTDLVQHLLEPATPLGVADAPTVVAVLGQVQAFGTITLILATSALLVHRFRRATRAQRRTLAPLYAFGILTILYIVFAANVLPPLFGIGLSAVASSQVVAIGLIPFAFALGVLRGGFARTAALEDLGLWLARGDREADPGAVVDALDRVIDDLRRLVHGVMPAMLVENGLAAAVEDLADRLPVRTDVDVRTGDSVLPPVVQSAAYFLVAEALTNAVKHSGASRLTVRVHRDDAAMHIEVCDDGRGGARIDGHGGLRGARDRVEALGGGFEVADLPGGGTRLLSRLPCAS